MTRYPFRVLNVFAESSLAGNALAVFETGAALSDELMQGLARSIKEFSPDESVGSS